MEEPRWTIDELGENVAAALAAGGYEGPANGQIRAIPNRRTIRYYTTLGLLDRPAEMDGRTALYSWRHLEQLVAIKRLQAQGKSLAEVQETLAGASRRRLARIADVDRGVVLAGGAGAARAKPEPAAPREEAFWRALPAGGEREGEGEGEGEREREREGKGPVLAQVALADRAALALAVARPLDDDDKRAIREAAGALVHVLESRGLLGSR